MYQYLSHVLTSETPRYGDQGPLHFRRSKQMCCGDSNNSTELEIAAHLGTHIDAPYHFDAQGAVLGIYPANFWHCQRVSLIEYPAQAAEVITLETLLPDLETVPEDTELLLLRTGWQHRRAAGPDSEYIFQGPGLGPDVGHWLRKNRQLKMIGFDFISLTSYPHRELGRTAHRAFLSQNLELGGLKESPILIVEDMKLADLQECPQEVWVLPLRFEQADGAPVTVVAR